MNQSINWSFQKETKMSKANQTSDSVNADIQRAGQAPVDVRKAAPINGSKNGSAEPPTSCSTR